MCVSQAHDDDPCGTQAPPAWCLCYTNTICMDRPIRKAHGLRARTTATSTPADHGYEARTTEHRDGARPQSAMADDDNTA